MTCKVKSNLSARHTKATYLPTKMTEAFTAGVMIFIEQFRARWPWSICEPLHANTPTATTPEDVSHIRGRNVEGK